MWMWKTEETSTLMFQKHVYGQSEHLGTYCQQNVHWTQQAKIQYRQEVINKGYR